MIIRYPTIRRGGSRYPRRERDVTGDFSWAHTFQPSLLLTVSPFYHFNLANYEGDPNDSPVSTTQHRASQYPGAQIVLNKLTARHNASVGVYQFGQWDHETVNLIANDGSAPPLSQGKRS